MHCDSSAEFLFHNWFCGTERKIYRPVYQVIPHRRGFPLFILWMRARPILQFMKQSQGSNSSVKKAVTIIGKSGMKVQTFGEFGGLLTFEGNFEPLTFGHTQCMQQ